MLKNVEQFNVGDRVFFKEDYSLTLYVVDNNNDNNGLIELLNIDKNNALQIIRIPRRLITKITSDFITYD